MEQVSGRKLSSMFYRERPGLKKWTEQAWLNYLEKRSNEKRFQYCSDSSGRILYMRAIHGHSGGSRDDLSLQDNVEIQYNWIQNMYHGGSSHYCNSVFQSGLIAGGKDSKEGRQIAFFTAVGPMNEPQRDELFGVNEPGEILYERSGKGTRMQLIGSTCKLLTTEE